MSAMVFTSRNGEALPGKPGGRDKYHWLLRQASSPYRPSRREYPSALPPIEYPGHFLVKRVTNAGTFQFKDRLHFIANALKTHHIGLEEINDGVWSIYLGSVLLARLEERDHIIRG